MHEEIREESTGRLARNHRRRIWRKIVSILACIVVFCTTYALILPAITLEKTPQGGNAGDTQASVASGVIPVCTFESLGIHEHTDDCLDEDGKYVCGYSDFVVHKHDEKCYDENGSLWCPLPEAELHTHDEKCYKVTETETIHNSAEEDSTEKETARTAAEEDSAETEPLVCALPESEEHTHDQKCEAEAEKATGTLSGELHRHTDACYDQEKVLTCGLSAGQPETAAGDGKDFVCGKEEIVLHEHGKECFDEDENLICGQVQVLEHQHTDACFRIVEETEDTGETETADGDVEEEQGQDTEEQVFQETQDTEATASEVPSDPHAVANLVVAENRFYALRAAARSGDPTDFTKDITGVTLQRKVGEKWVDVTDGKIQKDDQIRFKLNYTLPGQTLNAEKNTISYQLPDTFKMVKAESGKVYDNAGSEMGTYTISQDGKIEIIFDDDNVQMNSEGNQIIGFIAVEVALDNIQSEGNKVKIDFTDDLHIEFEIDHTEPDKSDVSVEKTQGTVSEDGKVSYTITVKSQNGTAGPVKLEDIMTDMGLEGEVAVTGPGIDDTNNSVTHTDKGFTIDLPQMNAGDAYTLTYTAQLPTDAVADVNGKNQVHVESTNKDGGKIEHSTTVDTSFRQTYVSKSGKVNGDKIIWTITVNQGKHDISGWTLKDTLNDADFTGTATITNSAGKEQQITLPYTFPSDSNDTYTITYETPAEKPLGGNQVWNRADLTPENGPGASDSDQVTIGGDSHNPITKKAESLTQNDNGTATIQWNVTIHTKEGSIEAPWVFKDTLENEQYFTPEQLNAIKTAIDAALQEANLNMSYTFTPITSNGKTTGYQLDVATPMEKGKSFTFSYRSTAPLKDGNTTLQFKNSADINNKTKGGDTITYTPLVRKYDQNQSNGDDTSHNYYEQNLDENGTLKWGIEVVLPKGYSGGDLTVTEKLPEGVTLKKLTMTPEGMCNEGDITAIGDHRFDYYPDHYIVKTAQDGRNITITIPEALAKHQKLSKTRFSVHAQIQEDFSWPTENGKPVGSFRNEVEVTSGDGETHGIDSQTQTVTKDDSKKVLTKSHGTVQDNIIPYSIIVNPDGKDLLEGSDTLTLVDTVKVDVLYNAKNTTLSLVPGSVQVFRTNPDGTRGEPIEAAKVPYTLKVTKEALDLNHAYLQYLMKVSLPDETPLIVEYKYKVNSPDIGSDKKIENSARLEGTGESSEESSDSVSVKVTDSSAGAIVDGITAVKVNAENYSITLAGVKFNLYQYDALSNQYKQVTDANGTGVIYTAGKNGRISIQGLTYNTAYYLEEIEAPAGYLKAEKPYYFYIQNSDTGTYPNALPSDFDGRVCTGGDTVYISNETDTTEIQVDKRWFNKEGEETTDTKGGSIRFDLYRKKSSVNPGGAAGGEVEFRFRAYSYGKLLYEKAEKIPVGSVVNVSVTMPEGQDIDTLPPDKLTVTMNGSTVTMQKKKMVFFYQFTIRADTDFVMESYDWHFQYADKYSVKIDPPEITEPTPDTVEMVDTYTISSTDGWKWNSGKLPKSGTASDGSTEYYTYYVQEAPVVNCKTEYENNNGIVSGTITINNTVEQEMTHELPATGGPGTILYTMGGLLTICAELLLLYKNKKRRKEDFASF